MLKRQKAKGKRQKAKILFFFPFSFFLLPWSAATVLAESPAYTIKLKAYPDKGQVISCREIDKQTGVIRFLAPDGKLLKEESTNEETEEIYTLTVLEPGERAPAHYRQIFGKAMASTAREKKRSYEGLAVDFILKGGSYKLSVPEKAEVTEKDREALLTRANGDLQAGLDQIFQPDKPVKEGESWTVPFALLNRGFGALGKLDPDKTRGSAKLMKVYEKEGKQFGAIEINLGLAFQKLDEIPFDPPARFQINGALDTAIDGSSCAGILTTFTRLMGKTQLEQGGAKVTLVIVREGSGRKERFPIKK